MLRVDSKIIRIFLKRSRFIFKIFRIFRIQDVMSVIIPLAKFLTPWCILPRVMLTRSLYIIFYTLLKNSNYISWRIKFTYRQNQPYMEHIKKQNHFMVVEWGHSRCFHEHFEFSILKLFLNKLNKQFLQCFTLPLYGFTYTLL